jgi:hypothetical protein
MDGETNERTDAELTNFLYVKNYTFNCKPEHYKNGRASRESAAIISMMRSFFLSTANLVQSFCYFGVILLEQFLRGRET